MLHHCRPPRHLGARERDRRELGGKPSCQRLKIASHWYQSPMSAGRPRPAVRRLRRLGRAVLRL